MEVKNLLTKNPSYRNEFFAKNICVGIGYRDASFPGHATILQ